RPGQAVDRQRAHGGVQGRQDAEGDRGRVPDRPQAPPQGRNARPGGEVQDQPGTPVRRKAARRDPRPLHGRQAPRGHAGERVRRPDGPVATATEGGPMKRIVLAAAALALGGCASTYQLTLMPRDSGRLYTGALESVSSGEGRIAVDIEGKHYAGTWVESAPASTSGWVTGGYGYGH